MLTKSAVMQLVHAHTQAVICEITGLGDLKEHSGVTYDRLETALGDLSDEYYDRGLKEGKRRGRLETFDRLIEKVGLG
jgi:hypothetical protein